MKNKALILTIISIVIVFGLLYLVYMLTNTSTDQMLSQIMTITSQDHMKWSSQKKHILIEYSDIQCPACKLYHEMLTSFESSAEGKPDIVNKVTLVYRHFPLYQIHSNAFDTAYAVEAAGKQNKFYEMLDILFKDQLTLSKTNFNEYLKHTIKKLNLDEKKFYKDIASDEVKSKVNNDLKLAEKADINSTPTFFLDGKKLELQTPKDLKKILSDL